MVKRKNRGVSSTKNVRNTVGNKGIFSNRSTGNIVRTKLSPKAEANLRKVKEFMARKSKFVRAQEFAGKGKTLEILDLEDDVKGKFGDTLQIKLREPETNTERIWSTSSIRAINAIYPLIKRGVTLIHVWTTGIDMDTQYYAKEVGSQGSKVKKGQRKKN